MGGGGVNIVRSLVPKHLWLGLVYKKRVTWRKKYLLFNDVFFSLHNPCAYS